MQADRLSIRLPREHKKLIDQAASLQGQTVSAFVVGTLVEHARTLVQAHEQTVLTARDRDRFLALLDAPADVRPALHRARERHARLVADSDVTGSDAVESA